MTTKNENGLKQTTRKARKKSRNVNNKQANMQNIKRFSFFYNILDKHKKPIIEIYNSEIFYKKLYNSKIRIITKKILKYKNQNKIFTNGIFIENYIKKKIILIIKSKKAYFYSKKKIYKLIYFVKIKNFIENEKITTNKLYYNFKKKEIYTENLIKLKTKKYIIIGNGFLSKEDLSRYIILNPIYFNKK